MKQSLRNAVPSPQREGIKTVGKRGKLVKKLKKEVAGKKSDSLRVSRKRESGSLRARNQA